MLRIFVHCTTSLPYATAIAATAPGMVHDAERALLLTQPGDILCVPEPLDADHLAYLAELGVGACRGDIMVLPAPAGDSLRPLWQRLLDAPEVLGRLAQRIRNAGGATIDPYIIVDGQYELAARLQQLAGRPVHVAGGHPRAVAYADQKHEMRAVAQALGIPVADGEVVEISGTADRLDQDRRTLHGAIARWSGLTGRAIIRGSSGASGSSAFIVRHDDAETEAVVQQLAARTDNRFYLVESMVDATVSPNVAMSVMRDDGAIVCDGVTDQRWSRPLTHTGNQSPSVASMAPVMIRWSHLLARWLVAEGFAGTLGFDFVEYPDPKTGRPRAIFAEVNPRVNGASYALALAARLRRETFITGAVQTRARSFAELRALVGEYFYRPATGVGLVPYATGLLPRGGCLMAAFAGTPKAAAALLAAAEDRSDRPHAMSS